MRKQYHFSNARRARQVPHRAMLRRVIREGLSARLPGAEAI